MKAIFTRSLGQLVLGERAKPEPGPTEVRVRVTHAGICHTDQVIAAGKLENASVGTVLGHEFSGVVDATGGAVTSLKVGDRVVVHHIVCCGSCTWCLMGDTHGCPNVYDLGIDSDGGFAEFCNVPARFALKIPDTLELGTAALAEPLANAVAAVRRAAPQRGERIVVIGPGPIGLLVTQVARLYSPSALVLIGLSDNRLDVGKRVGATWTINAARQDAEQAIRAGFGDAGADIVFDCAGNTRAFRLAESVIGWRGRIVIEGIYEPEDLISVNAYNLLLRKSATIVGVNGWNTAEFAEALSLLSEGVINTGAIITHEFPISDWEEAFRLNREEAGGAIKVMLRPS